MTPRRSEGETPASMPEADMPQPAMPQADMEPVTIGWVEAAALPEWKVRRIRAKMDTGARTSALDVPHYHLVETDDGTFVELHLALSRHRRQRVKCVRTPLRNMVTVCTTCGTRERRPVVEMLLRLGPVEKRIRVTITNRANMRYRLILGRTALEKDFVVDVSRKNLMKDRTSSTILPSARSIGGEG